MSRGDFAGGTTHQGEILTTENSQQTSKSQHDGQLQQQADEGVSAAIILAAGEGTRMCSQTPKVLHALGGKTLLNRVISSVQQLNPQRLAVVVHHQAERVAAAARSYDDAVTIIRQDDIPGTGRAVQCAMKQLCGDGQQNDKLSGAVLIAASDMPLLDAQTLQSLIHAHIESGNGATVLTAMLDNPYGYGRIIRDQQGNVLRIVEQKDANSTELAVHEVNTSVYVFDADVLSASVEGLDSDNAQGEFYLTDALEEARRSGRHVGAFAAPDALAVEGVNDRIQLAHLAKAHNRRVCESWMLNGVTILDPETTWIEDDVEIACDVTVLPGCFLQGHTVIAERAVVGPYTTLIDARIDEGATVERSRVQESHIGAEANIGPWTYMRPGNELKEQTKAGAFVEMKKAHIDKGSKVPHLSYIGDAHIGEHSNVGGGTITANYDGVHKNHTEIGSNVHVGADNVFVAPVEVGDGVTTGAGSVIRHQVADNSMVYSENTQHEKKHWKPSWER
ncbi:bifunctional N-acetylglucosamine-1-phosphate uridyltransferase/glucosamine-1-phosphate acetyltransferase [Bifidobacterium aquikefiri]|uniref:Bifunctional protein GlmU n=1 Tax=Bifidobacterium aquikefiri TaxID=1653207 RepID=A0A261G319_9BIFI|nr:bifunctional N-acetylglucosamine-1-phosphate uridyltransferase/glucosamine-1-phosphate acetyltransferase [Bifidobacterium aquikefiri]